MKYRKKPIVIEAVQLTKEVFEESAMNTVRTFMAGSQAVLRLPDGIEVATLEGNMKASINDWIIKGVNGEFYPCKPDIFEKTYEPASTPEGKPEEVKPWPLLGYAPGNYMNTCASCGKQMERVDKLCFMCLECAVIETHKELFRLRTTANSLGHLVNAMNATPPTPEGKPGECPHCCECDEKCHAFFDDGHECNKTYQRSKCPYCHPEGKPLEVVEAAKEADRRYPVVKRMVRDIQTESGFFEVDENKEKREIFLAGSKYSGQDQGKHWNRVVAIVAAGEICKNTIPGDGEGLDNWKIEVINRLSKEFIIKNKT